MTGHYYVGLHKDGKTVVYHFRTKPAAEAFAARHRKTPGVAVHGPMEGGPPGKMIARRN